MLQLYKNIRARREALGFSQEQLAKKVGYTDRSSIAKIESGLVDITQSKIEAFADALETTPGELMGWEQAPTPPPSYTNEHGVIVTPADPAKVAEAERESERIRKEWREGIVGELSAQTDNPSDTIKKAPQGELEEYLEELRTRPETRMLMSVTKDATKAEIEQAVKVIMALRGEVEDE